MRIVVVGASRGIGAAVAQHLVDRGHEVHSVSRSHSSAGRWVHADVSTRDGCMKVVQALGDGPLDALLYMGGTWETGAFTEEFDYLRCDDEDMRRVIDVNLVAPIRLAQGFITSLSKASSPRVVFMGALSGLPNRATAEVANTASKTGLLGAAQAMALTFKTKGIGTTVINPGNVATPEVVSELEHGVLSGGEAIPMRDLLACIDLVISMSSTTDVERIDLSNLMSRTDTTRMSRNTRTDLAPLRR